MKRKKAKAIRATVELVLGERDALWRDRPVMLETLTVDFERRTVAFRGRLLGPIDARAIDLPIVSTDHIVIPGNRSGFDVWSQKP